MCTTRTTSLEELRADAERRLKAGSAPSNSGWMISAEALTRLYRLSSNSETAADALRLLQELQTHQVELDLQLAQREENEQELSAQLAHYQALYEKAPMAYVLLDRDGRMLQTNSAAMKLFGLGRDPLNNHSLASLLNPESRPAFKAMLQAPNQSLRVLAQDSRPLHLVSSVAPQDDAILMLIFAEAPASD